MAHHSSMPDDGMREFMRKFGKLGPTGDFPQGKLTPADEGGIRIAIFVRDGKVVIDFGSPTAWIGFDPDQADALAASIVAKAKAARGDPTAE